jgi:hypothetical protein
VSWFRWWRWLDKPSGLAKKAGMISIGSGGAGRSVKALKRELRALGKRCEKLWGELGAQEQEYVERKLSRAPAGRAFERYEILRDRYWAAETRRVQLRGLVAERGAPGDDLP